MAVRLGKGWRGCEAARLLAEGLVVLDLCGSDEGKGERERGGRGREGEGRPRERRGSGRLGEGKRGKRMRGGGTRRRVARQTGA